MTRTICLNNPKRNFKKAVFFNGFLFTALAAVLGACSFEAATPKFSGRKEAPPEIEAAKSTSPEELKLVFSEPVSLVSISFDSDISVKESAANGCELLIRFTKALEIGQRVAADVVVANAKGSTLEAIVPFTAYNDRVPKFLINELRTESSKPRVEFIELKALADGNLAAVRLFAASNGTEQPIYEFPAVEVRENDYILLHIRSPEYINCVDELGGDLELSGLAAGAGLTSAQEKQVKTDCPNDVRDIWLPANKEFLRKSDAVYFCDQEDKIIDALLFCDKAKDAEKWQANSNFQKAFSYLNSNGAWQGESFEDILDSGGTTPTSTICRKEAINDTNSAADFFVALGSKMTPGKPNAFQ